MIQEIRNLDNYIEIMNKIEFFIQKATKSGGIDSLPKEEFDALNDLSLMANAYEKNARAYFLSQPKSISDALKIKMMQLRLKQKDMAHRYCRISSIRSLVRQAQSEYGIGKKTESHFEN